MLIDAFLTEVQADMEAVEKKLPRLESNPADGETWNGIIDFFEKVRFAAPFTAFPRAYKLANAALSESKNRSIDALPSVLKKFVRLKKIMATAVKLRREPRESDADLLQEDNAAPLDVRPSNQAASALLQTARLLSQKEKNVLLQEHDLDSREEQLLLRAKMLDNREDDLNKRENGIFKDEKKNVDAQTKIAAVLADIQKREAELDEKLSFLKTQEKGVQDARRFLAEKSNGMRELKQTVRVLQAEKEDKDKKIADVERELVDLQGKLNQNTAESEQMRTQIKDKDLRQEENRKLLESKNKTIQDLTGQICRLEEELFEKSEAENRTESELRQELQQTKQQLRDSENSLQNLQLQYARSEENACRIGADLSELQHKYDEMAEHFTQSKQSAEDVLDAKENAERRLTDLQGRLEVLSDEMNVKSEQLEQTSKELETDKRAAEKLRAELRAAGWPFDVEKIQKDFAALLEGDNSRSAAGLYAFIRKARSKPLSELFVSLQNFVAVRAQKLNRVYTFDTDAADMDVDCGAWDALDRIFRVLTDNSLRYASPETQTVSVRVSVEQSGSFLKVLYCDNSSAVPFEKIRGAAVEAGLCSPQDAAELSKDRLLRCLFHPRVLRDKQSRGLLDAVRLLEQSGGQVRIWDDRGVCVEFYLPKQYLFDKVLTFEVSGGKYAVPLNMVAETFSLNGADVKNGFDFKGQTLPVLSLPGTQDGDAVLGIVLQAGIFNFLMPVQKITETDAFVSFVADSNAEKTPYLKPCVTLGGLRADWIDVSFLLNLCPPEMTGAALPVSVEKPEIQSAAPMAAYLVYRCDSKNVGAVPVDKVLKIEAFDGVKMDGATNSPVFIADGKMLPLKDSSNKKHFPFAQTVLIFADYALAIQDVLDIVDAPVEKADKILYQGKKIPVLKN